MDRWKGRSWLSQSTAVPRAAQQKSLWVDWERPRRQLTSECRRKCSCVSAASFLTHRTSRNRMGCLVHPPSGGLADSDVCLLAQSREVSFLGWNARQSWKTVLCSRSPEFCFLAAFSSGETNLLLYSWNTAREKKFFIWGGGLYFCLIVVQASLEHAKEPRLALNSWSPATTSQTLGFQARATTSGCFLHLIFWSVTNTTVLQTSNHALHRGSSLSTPPTCPHTVTCSSSFLGKGDTRLEEQHLYSAVTTRS